MKNGIYALLKPTVALLIVAALLAPGTIQVAQAAQASSAKAAPMPEMSKKEQLGSVEATEVPVAKLKDWKNSKQEERYAFIFGFVTMMGMESNWQQAENPAYKTSPLHAWNEGLCRKTIKEIDADMMAYIAANPTELERPVVEFMWTTYAKQYKDSYVPEKVATSKAASSKKMPQSKK